MASLSAGQVQANSPQPGSGPQIPVKPAMYVLGPGDQISVQLTPGGEELTGRQWRLDDEGNITLPMIGTVHAAGLTGEQLEKGIAQKYKVYYRDPQVIVSLTESNTTTIVGRIMIASGMRIGSGLGRGSSSINRTMS